MKQLFTNNAVSLLRAPLSSSATSLTVLAGDGVMFPSPQSNEFFTITLEDQAALNREIVHVTARSGDVLTILRGQEGTAARNWSAAQGADTLVDHRVTAETLRRLANEYTNSGFQALTTYKEALDYLLSLDLSNPDLTAINNAIAALQQGQAQLEEDLGPVVDQLANIQQQITPLADSLDQLQQQVIINNDFDNPNFPDLNSFTEAIDYLLDGGQTAGQTVVDADIMIEVVSGQTKITTPTAFVAGSTAVYIGGLRQKRGVDFLETGPTELRLQFAVTTEQIAEGQNVVVDYVVA